ncbi:MAG TPA: hypothetical protein VEZ15_09945 [Acidimicrobiia bacterium]|nr:hypothetical protein [Acidimicrobiia bacterium]
MELLGAANWWLPRLLERVLPRVRIDDHGIDAEVDKLRDDELVGTNR